MASPGIQDNDQIRVAFVGNSILYFNDCPRVLESMLQTRFSNVQQNSCLRGGTTLTELWVQGNGMDTKFAQGEPGPDGTYDIGAPTVTALLDNDQWDFLVLNDFTQGPARVKTRRESKVALEQYYIPLMKKCGATPVVLQTSAYRKPIRNSQDLGTVEEWTQLLEEGCQEYVSLCKEQLPESQAPLLAPVGNAYLKIHNEDLSLWEKLFFKDDFHPSPHGTWLQACILYCTMLREPPPIYDPSIWDKCRYMQRPKEEPMPLPTAEEAQTLRQYARDVCGV